MSYMSYRYGEIIEIKLLKDLSYAFVCFKSKECAEDALKGLNGRSFQNKKLEVSWSERLV